MLRLVAAVPLAVEARKCPGQQMQPSVARKNDICIGQKGRQLRFAVFASGQWFKNVQLRRTKNPQRSHQKNAVLGTDSKACRVEGTRAKFLATVVSSLASRVANSSLTRAGRHSTLAKEPDNFSASHAMSICRSSHHW